MSEVIAATATGLFGGNSDGYSRMEGWLKVMCRGCLKDRGRGPSGGMGGMSCPIPLRAGDGQGSAEMPEWSLDAPKPDRLAAELGDGPWPVCTAYQPRKTRSDKGRRRAARDMDTLFEIGAGT